MAKEYIIDFSPSHPAQRFTMELGGQLFNFRFYKVHRTQQWYLSIWDKSNTPLIEGLRVVCLRSLFRGYDANQRFPFGYLWCVDVTHKLRDPDGDLLGNDVKIFFYSYNG